jgi:hypothetical protein
MSAPQEGVFWRMIASTAATSLVKTVRLGKCAAVVYEKSTHLEPQTVVYVIANLNEHI